MQTPVSAWIAVRSATPNSTPTSSPARALGRAVCKQEGGLGPVLSASLTNCSPLPSGSGRGGGTCPSRLTPIGSKMDRRNPSVWRSGRCRNNRSVSAVSIATSEYWRCPPRRRVGLAFHVVVALGGKQSVMLPRSTSGSCACAPIPGSLRPRGTRDEARDGIACGVGRGTVGPARSELVLEEIS